MFESRTRSRDGLDHRCLEGRRPPGTRLAVRLLAAGALLLSACGGESGADAGGVDAAMEMDAGEVVEGCGDGRLDRDSELCDDGNTDDGDGCSADCLSDETCGNGTRDDAAGEQCDDGNTDDGDACRGDCGSDYACGNGIVDTAASGADADEACDDGNTTNGDGCSAACDSDESCGNDIVDLGAGEVCDDGNTDGDDDCSGDCRTSLLCGNGEMDGAEECDDGGNEDADGCSATCLIERCGNGRVDAGETCDDGNAEPNDGCGTGCEFTCATDTDCADADVCNGVEVCTDPDSLASRCGAGDPLSNGDACGTDLLCDGGSCVAAECGDGFVTGDEDCDDTNTTAGDGCENDCSFTCDGDSDCDDANACNGTETCTSPGTGSSMCAAGTPPGDGTSCGSGNVCNGGTCASPGCGDGIVTGAEQCDDDNDVEGDGCDNDCRWTCESATDCSDANVCNGAETCTGGGTLASRCGAGTAPAEGSDCGAGNICRTGACVMPRCGDGLVTGAEDCDDTNSTPGDGCENDCSWTCEGDSDCDDGAVCNGAETCASPGTLASRCGAGTPPASGTVCDADGMPGTRDVCTMSTQTCAASFCGDGITDAGATPAEECDDGNMMSGDSCSPACVVTTPTPPTGFRVTSMRLISPHIVANIPFGGCQDITDDCASTFLGCAADSVNQQIQTAVDEMADSGTYSLHLVNVFRPLDQVASTTPVELHTNPTCTEAAGTDSCVAGAPPESIVGTANNMSAGTCYTPDPTEVNLRAGAPASYSPTANSVSGPCFSVDYATLTVNLSGIIIPLTDATVSGTYSGGPPANRLVSGTITGFLSSMDATVVLLPDTIPVLGGNPLYNFLQAGNAQVAGESDACNLGGGVHEDDRDEGGTGFRFFLNFTAEVVDWSDM